MRIYLYAFLDLPARIAGNASLKALEALFGLVAKFDKFLGASSVRDWLRRFLNLPDWLRGAVEADALWLVQLARPAKFERCEEAQMEITAQIEKIHEFSAGTSF